MTSKEGQVGGGEGGEQEAVVFRRWIFHFLREIYSQDSRYNMICKPDADSVAQGFVWQAPRRATPDNGDGVAERLSRAKFSARVLGLQLVKLEYLGDLL